MHKWYLPASAKEGEHSTNFTNPHRIRRPPLQGPCNFCCLGLHLPPRPAHPSTHSVKPTRKSQNSQTTEASEQTKRSAKAKARVKGEPPPSDVVRFGFCCQLRSFLRRPSPPPLLQQLHPPSAGENKSIAKRLALRISKPPPLVEDFFFFHVFSSRRRSYVSLFMTAFQPFPPEHHSALLGDSH